MEPFDSQGKVLPIGAADQGILSKKISDKEGHHRQVFQGKPKAKASASPPPEEDEGPGTENHRIDIVV